MITQYIVVTANEQGLFNSFMAGFIEQGWQPVGNIVVTQNFYTFKEYKKFNYFQTMSKED